MLDLIVCFVLTGTHRWLRCWKTQLREEKANCKELLRHPLLRRCSFKGFFSVVFSFSFWFSSFRFFLQRCSDDGSIKSVREVMEKEEVLSELLLFASGAEQNELLFLSAVQGFKKDFSLAGARQIMSIYCNSSSPRFLDQSLSFKRINLLERTFADPSKWERKFFSFSLFVLFSLDKNKSWRNILRWFVFVWCVYVVSSFVN